MNAITNFQSSLFILKDCHEKLETMFFEFKKYPVTGIESISNPILSTIRNYIILETASFLDEYEINFLEINNRTPQSTGRNQRPVHPIEQQYWVRIESLHVIIKPLLKVLNRWTEIKKFRNNYVGHGSRATWRDGNKLNISSQEPYDAPRKVFEFQIMRDIIHLIFGLISQEFKMELIHADFSARTLKSVMNPSKDNNSIDLELFEMISDIVKEINNQTKDYTLNVADLQYDGLKSLVQSMPKFIHPLTRVQRDIREKHPEILNRIKDDIKRTERKRKRKD